MFGRGTMVRRRISRPEFAADRLPDDDSTVRRAAIDHGSRRRDPRGQVGDIISFRQACRRLVEHPGSRGLSELRSRRSGC